MITIKSKADLWSDKHFIHDSPVKPGFKHFAKAAHNEFRCIASDVQTLRRRVEPQPRAHDVAICAIFKDEAPYLREWIEFHKIVGVGHFFLYNNNSSDDPMSVLKHYVDEGVVTVVDWPEPYSQMKCYRDCIERFASTAKWLGFIDLDEFVVPKSTETIYEFLRQFDRKAGSVLLYWRFYCTSGLLDRDRTGLVTEDFTVSWPKYDDVGKCFYNTSFGFDADSKKNSHLHHMFWSQHAGKDIPPVNCFGKTCLPGRNRVTDSDFPIQINHYFSKSYAEYREKCAKGDVFFEANPHNEQYLIRHESRCTGVDYSAYKYLRRLKMAMAEAGEE